MFRQKVSSVVQRTVMAAANRTNATDESLAHVLRAFRDAAEPFADADEALEAHCPSGSGSSGGPAVLTCRRFAASLACPKKFHLMMNRPDLMPDSSIVGVVELDDAAAFGELARRWDRLQFGSRAVVVNDRDFDGAVQRTEEVLIHYFETIHAQLGEQAPSLTIHRPAFAAPFGRAAVVAATTRKKNLAARNPIVLRARPSVLRFRPKDNQWVILESAAFVDPFSNAARQAQCLQRMHFTTLAFRYWISQPHIPIQIRKRFLNIDHDIVTAENLKGHSLEATAEVAVPLDLKRSGLLHIRQFFPGPVTLMDCDPSRLVKYVQRLSLEDMIHAESCARSASSSSSNLSAALNFSGAESLAMELQKKVDALQELGNQHRRLGQSTSSRAVKKVDTHLQQLFAAQQKLMEAVITTHTLRILEEGKDPEKIKLWTSFANDSDDYVKATFPDDPDLSNSGISTNTSKETNPQAKGRGSKKKSVENTVDNCSPAEPCMTPYASFVGAHCSRGVTCPFFAEGLCLPRKFDDPIKERDNHLFTVPFTAVSRKATWWAQGLRTAKDVLHEYKRGSVKLTAPQLRYVKAVAAGQLCINPKEIEDFFANIQYPAFFIDFEATQFALPPFDKVVAYQPTPFQFSLDVFQENILNETPVHYDFLHFGKGYSPNVDPRRGCIKELLRIVRLEREKKRVAMEASGELERIARQQEAAREEEEANAANGKKRRGPKPKKVQVTRNNPLQQPVNPYDGCFVAHFASFEKSCLEKLGQLVDEHKEEIKQFYFLDTIDLFKRGIVHPNAHGSNSLKKVLPALCPDFQYGVFGEEATGDDHGGAGGGDDGGRQDEQKGENVMGVFRIWHNQEGGGALRDIQHIARRDMEKQKHLSSTSEAPAVVPVARQVIRDKAWAMLRIQLLEYCSLDTKALYEIMRQVWIEKEAVKGVKPDKGGWVMTNSVPREYNL